MLDIWKNWTNGHNVKYFEWDIDHMWFKIQQMALNPLNKTGTTQNSQFNKCTQCIYQKGEYIRKSSRCGI